MTSAGPLALGDWKLTVVLDVDAHFADCESVECVVKQYVSQGHLKSINENERLVYSLATTLQHSYTWTITSHCTIHWQTSQEKKKGKVWAAPLFLQLLIKPRKYSLEKKCCIHVYFLPPPCPGMKEFAEATQTQTSPWIQYKHVTGHQCGLAKWENTHVLNTSQTVGIDYHLFKSETKVGQLQ